MTQIGRFARTDNGYVGRLQFLTVNAQAVFVPTGADTADKAPDFRIHLDNANGPEIGAGWKRKADKAGDFVSVVIDDPTFAQPIHANLFLSSRNDGAWSLQWTRTAKRSDGAK